MNAAEQEQLHAFHAWLTEACERGPVPVLTGKNGDMDTIGSAIALSASHPRLMACGIHIGRTAKRVVENLQAPFRKIAAERTSWPAAMGGLIIVDAAAPGQVGVQLPEGVPMCIIDHHATSDWELKDGDMNLQWEVRATTQIIDRYLMAYAPMARSDDVRKMLLAGLITDTGRFRHADAGAFESAQHMLTDSSIDYASFLQFIESETTSPSERGSLLRGLSRAKSVESGPWNIVHTYSGTLEGRLAGMLVGTGAEIALVSRFRDGQTRLTARAPRSSTQQGIHLGHLMSAIAERIGGEGGGHDGAAGWSGNTDRIAAESAFIAQVAIAKRKEDL
ncbi:MAG: DHHA1 domain-containing protein [Candidatus Poseidoniaceae archaeon]|mgnify:FL=1|jgi:phosphoesterase RecJ-like protein|tara:strand:- start:849 stop:1850 length:1002 start_codon:yes stop_codon:yes gene_type:complete